MRPVGPLTLNTQPTNGPPIVLDYYNKAPNLGQLTVEESAIGTLAYVAEYSVLDPFASYATDFSTNGKWATLGAGTLVGTVRTFNLPAPPTVVTAVRLRSTGGAGVATYFFLQGSSGG